MSFTRKGILQIMYKFLQEELEQKVDKICISFNLSVHSSFLTYLQGRGGGSERMKFA